MDPSRRAGSASQARTSKPVESGIGVSQVSAGIRHDRRTVGRSFGTHPCPNSRLGVGSGLASRAAGAAISRTPGLRRSAVASQSNPD